jgi:hypothetical protein
MLERGEVKGVALNLRRSPENHLQVLNADAQYYQSKIGYAQRRWLYVFRTRLPYPDNFLMTLHSYDQK